VTKAREPLLRLAQNCLIDRRAGQRWAFLTGVELTAHAALPRLVVIHQRERAGDSAVVADGAAYFPVGCGGLDPVGYVPDDGWQPAGVVDLDREPKRSHG